MEQESVELRVVAVRSDPQAGQIVELTTVSGMEPSSEHGRRLSIFVGILEAEAIEMGLRKLTTPRPLTHDLLGTVIDSLGYELEYVVIVSVVDMVFYAELSLAPKDLAAGVGGTSADHLRTVVVGSRTSDALALALRLDRPIFAHASVMAEAGYEDLPEGAGPDSVLAEFRDFIDNISPEDFGENFD